MMPTNPNEPRTQQNAAEIAAGFKRCARCGENKPLSDFLRRTGKRSAKGSRRGTCRSCRAQLKSLEQTAVIAADPRPITDHAARNPVHRIPPVAAPPKNAKRMISAPLPVEGPDASVLRPNRQGKIRMRGRTDKGSRWHQEIDLELAVTLVQEHAAVVVNRNTIRRLYSNKAFRRYILARDRHTCFFCGNYGDTIDHLLPKAKGGHTTPVNCVCACNECNQSKADRDLEDFIGNS